MRSLIALFALLLAFTVGTAHAQQPQPQVNYVWKIVLFNFVNQRQAVLPPSYPDQNTCQLALIGLGYNAIDVLGVHGKCRLIPLVGGKYRGHPVLRSRG